jgi:predicted extracellular nuclease
MCRKNQFLLLTLTIVSLAGLFTASRSVRAAGAFTPGNLVIYRVGTGLETLANTGNSVFLDEFKPDGTFVQSVAMPTTTSAPNKRLIASGTATSEGLITRSSDGRFLILSGYDASLGGATNLANATGTVVPRVVGRVDAAGVIDTTTSLTDFSSTNNPRSATSSDGTKFWVAGGAGGARFASIGASTSTQLSTTVTNLRGLQIFGGQLYTSDSSGSAVRVGTVGAGLPTTVGQTIVNLPGFPVTGSPYGFFFADLDGTPGVDTLYVADDGTSSPPPGGITKYALVAGSWISKGSVGAIGDAYRGLTGSVSGTAVTLYATRKGGGNTGGGGELVSIADTSGYNGAFAGTPSLLATAASATAFRGVAFAPGTPSIQLSVSSNSASEGSPAAITVTATASGPVAGAQTVNVTVSGTGITAGDYTLSNSTITIPDGATSGSVTFTVVDDALIEGTETATLTIGSPSSGLTLGSPISQNITIADNDFAAAVTDLAVSLTASPEPVTVNQTLAYTIGVYASGGAATGVSVQLGLPPNATFVSASGTNGFSGAPAGNTVVFSGGSLNAGGSATLTVFVTPTTTGSITSGAAVVDPFSTIAESDESNNIAPGVTTTVIALNTAPTISLIPALSGVIADPTNPSVAVTVGDAETPAAALIVTATATTNGAVAPLANVTVGGSGGNRTVSVNPAGVGYATITVTVTDAGGLSASSTLSYAASAASVSPSTSRFHTGASDGSTAIAIDSDYMLVGDDENQTIRLYSRSASGLPVQGFDFNSVLNLTDVDGHGQPREIDLEASTRIGNRLFWIGSQDNNSDGELRPNRDRVFATDLTAAGASSQLTFAGRYDHLREDLIAWDANNGHGLGANHYGFATSAAAGKIPEAPDGSGFNIEGASVGPDGSTVYLGFRAPIVPVGSRTRGLIVPVTNFGSLVAMDGGVAGSATFGTPIELNLGGRGIRSIERNAAGTFLIIAGPVDGATGVAPKDLRLFTWTGNAVDAPVLHAADLTSLAVAGSFEGIVDVPSPLLDSSEIQLIVDNGDANFYGDGMAAKDLTEPNFKKFRSERVVLGAALPPETSAVGATPTVGDIIFNEYAAHNYANGNDFFELLVLKDGLDLRGLRVSDNELTGGALNNNESVFVFGNDAFLSNVPSGTLIAVYTLATGVATDTVVNPVLGDWTMVLAPGTGVTASVDGLGGSLNTGLAQGGDALYLYLPGPDGTSAGTDNVYLDFVSWGSQSPTPDAPGGIANLHLSSSFENAYFTGHTAAAADIAANWAGYSGVPTAQSTPGAPNPGEDLSAIRFGGPLTPGVVVTQSGGSTNVTEGGPADTYTIALKTVPGGTVQIQAVSATQTELSLDGTTFAPAVTVTLAGTSPATVYVRAIDDFIAESTTTSTITHSIVSSGDAGYSNALTPVASVVATVADNDVLTTAIHDIQGVGDMSPFVGQFVTTSGIVTARKSNGFYIQTPDAQIDANPLTSEGVFVFTSSAPSPAAAVGNLVLVSGTVQEFVPSADPGSPPTTEIGGSPAVTLLSTGNPLPAPVTITAASMQPGLVPFEAFEGMRVHIDVLNVIAPTDGFVDEANASSTSSGVFHAVLPGVARPFREPGLEIGDPAPSEATSPSTIPRFDGNGERLRIESTTLGGAPIDVTSFATVSDVTGVVDFRFRASTILVEPTSAPVVAGNISAIPVRLRAGDEFTVGSFNMERFFDTINDPSVDDVALTAAAFERRLSKASLAIRNVLGSPDVIGVEEMENLSTLQAVADRVNGDAVAAGDSGVVYQPFLMEGNDVGGIDVGFLVNTVRVQVVDATQVGKDTTYLPPGSSTPALLNDRPSLVLRAKMMVPGFPLYPVTVIVNHLRSLSGVDDPADGLRVRTKRRLQAEFLAAYIQSRQAANPAERIISVGDYNAFQFNDGFGDSIGTIKGTPTPATEVAQASPDFVSPDLVDLVDTAPADQRYSYTFDGNAQELDHILITQNLAGSISYARNDADFPEIYRNDATRPERISDHDMIVGYFPLAPDTTAPVVTVPDTIVTEATGPTTPVHFVATAIDDVDLVVAVHCAPESDTGFVVGDTTVSCTATDAHHNTSDARTFAVTVVDTTAPLLVVPTTTLTADATGPAGATVTYSATATDLVDGAIVPTCDYPSGSTFAAGLTTVSCAAVDAHGNGVSRVFGVLVAAQCAPGTYRATPGASCTPAPPGSYVDTTGATSATPCPAGTFSSAAGAASCTPAPAGSFVSAIGSTSAAPCPAGTFSNAGAVACTPAPAGSFVGTAGATTATPCPVGAFSISPGAVSCTPAPAGSFVSAAGATTATPCPAGTFSSAAGAASCTPAPANTYVPTPGATSATPCPPGTTSPVGATACSDTIAPTIDPHDNITVDATGPSGTVVAFTVPLSHDAVAGTQPTACAPASGSTFAIGVTTVTCTATDGSGNTSHSTFTVTVDDVDVEGRMTGDGSIETAAATLEFEFAVRERVPQGERGSLALHIDYRARGKKDDTFRSRTVAWVGFSDDPNFRPGRAPRPTVDSVTFAGAGEWNGRSGYTYTAKATDRGEPGRGRDTFEVIVSDPAGHVVATFAGTLDGGNIQSLRLAYGR